MRGLLRQHSPVTSFRCIEPASLVLRHGQAHGVLNGTPRLGRRGRKNLD